MGKQFRHPTQHYAHEQMVQCLDCNGHGFVEVKADEVTVSFTLPEASRRLDRASHEWVARLERLIVDDIYPRGVDQVAHAKEFRLVADMIVAGR